MIIKKIFTINNIFYLSYIFILISIIVCLFLGYQKGLPKRYFKDIKLTNTLQTYSYGRVFQETSRDTSVTLNKYSGLIQTDTTSLASGVSIAFTVNNNLIDNSYNIILNNTNTELALVYIESINNGSFVVRVKNNRGTAITTSMTISFFSVGGI